MSADWKSCPRCSLMLPPGDARHCPGCGQELIAAASPSESEWHYEIDRKKYGPVSQSQLKAMAARGELGPTSLVRRVEDAKWKRLRDVPELRTDWGARAEPGPKAEAKGEAKAEATFFARHRRRPIEIYAALAAIGAATVLYVLACRDGVPRPSGVLGLSLGIVGLALMLSAETLYSLRKRGRWLRAGRSSVWLQTHIFAGIVGPYLVLLHSAGRFQGLAGLATMLVLLIVASGFVGRYIYTAVPRTDDGAELALRELDDRLAEHASDLKGIEGIRLNRADIEAALAVPSGGGGLIFGRAWLTWRRRRVVRRALLPVQRVDSGQALRLERLLMDRYRLLLIKESLPATRRWMALWHLVHVPMGAILFTLAAFHVVGAVYYTMSIR